MHLCYGNLNVSVVMLTFGICKRLASQNSWNLISKNISFMSASLRCQCQKEFSELTKENDLKLTSDSNVLSKELFLASKLINELHQSKPVRWEEIVNKLKDSDVRNPHSTLLQCFLKQKNADYGVDYCNYLIKEGKQFTALELIMLLKLFSSRKDLILKNKTLIQYIYENVKHFLTSSPAVQNFVIDVIAEVPDCFYDYVKTLSEEANNSGSLVLAAKAFEINRPDLARKIFQSYKPFIPSKFAEAYLNYLLKMAENKKLLPHMITSMTKFYEKNVTTIDLENVFSYLKTICQSANKHNVNYIWSVKECTLNNVGSCSNCHNTLLHKNITETEFNYMKKDILSQIGLFDHSVFISTSVIELKKFFLFLSHCEPYDIVIDALNILYHRRHDGYGNLSRLIKHLLDEGQRVLVIGKKYAERKITNSPILKKESARGKVQFFFPSNLSDDDVFILYATLYNGLGTHLISADNLSRYVARLKTDQKDIFLKWKVFHQYNFNGTDLIPPRRHLGLPQLTQSPNKKSEKFVWHISYSSGISKINSNTPLKWVCLQAEPISTKEKENQFTNTPEEKN